MSWVWLVLAIASEVGGTLSLRASDGLRRRGWLGPVAAGYLGAFVFLGLALRAGVPVGVAYGVWAALGIVAVMLAARLIWGDRLTGRMLLGTACILVGVVLVEMG